MKRRIFIHPKQDLNQTRLRKKLTWYLSPFRHLIQSTRFLEPDTVLTPDDILLILDQMAETPNVPDGIRIYDLDDQHNKIEGALWLHMGHDLVIDHAPALEASHRRLMTVFKELKGRKALIVGTGPSIDTLTVPDLKDTAVIACNSIVKNTTLMAQLKPDIVTFTDPIFHAGWSDYAATFRDALIAAYRQRPFAMVCNMRDYYLFRHYLPDEMLSDLIGLPQLDGPYVNLDLKKAHWVRATNNVLTLTLLPLAASFASELLFAGFDGRPIDRSEYFWAHGKSVQFGPELHGIQKDHSAFFSLDYNDYYHEFLGEVEAMLRMTEAQGVVIHNLTASHNPSLILRGAAKLSSSNASPSPPELHTASEGTQSHGEIVRKRISDKHHRFEIRNVVYNGRYWRHIRINCHIEDGDRLVRIWPRDSSPHLLPYWPKELPSHPVFGPVLALPMTGEGDKRTPLTYFSPKDAQLFKWLIHLI